MAEPEGVAMPVDPYEAVLTDLRAKRDEIERVISTLEAFRAGGSVGVGVVSSSGSTASSKGIVVCSGGPGDYLGMSIVDASKKLLASRRKTMANPEIAASLKAGGLAMNSREPANTIGSVLTRRFQQVGDIVRVERGQWGLAEWYPNRNFKKKPAELIAGEPGGVVKETPVVGSPKGDVPPTPDVLQ